MESSPPSIVKILLTGSSGFVGQHLLHMLMKRGPPLAEERGQRYEITALYHSSKNFPRALLDYQREGGGQCHPNVRVIPKKCNLADYDDDSPPCDVCIHAAAMSSPRACHDNPTKADAVNCPEGFLKAMRNVTLFIALSTDQVYDGTRQQSDGYYREDVSESNPLNVYARTKVRLENFLRETRGGPDGPQKSRTVILRSSIIVGPRAPISPHDAHETFFHFCASRDGMPTDLWHNEHRSIVGVGHVCDCIAHFVREGADDPYRGGGYGVYNMGGRERVNRHEIGLAVFGYLGHDKSCLRRAEQTSPTVPLDIAMDSSKLEKETGITHRPSTLRGLVEYTFGQ